MSDKDTPRKRFEEIAEHLELQVFSGRIAIGDKIPSERELMERFGVGRSTVREALFTLQRKGLLSMRPGAAARISRPSAASLVNELSGAARHLLSRPDGVRDLQHARALLEVGLARHAALHASSDELTKLTDALEANGRASDQRTFEKTDLEFHSTLAVISHNPIFTSLNYALTEWLAEQRSVSARVRTSHRVVYLEHKAIHDAIVERDAARAEAAMEAHLSAVYQNYWKAAQPVTADVV